MPSEEERMQANDPGLDDPRDLDRDAARDVLSQLIRDVNDNGAGVSFQHLADRAIDPKTGTTLSKSYFQKLAANQTETPPTEERIRAIAAALRKPESLVQRAAAVQFFGYQATELSGYDEETRIIVAHLAGKSAAERRRWRMMMEAWERSGDD